MASYSSIPNLNTLRAGTGGGRRLRGRRGGPGRPDASIEDRTGTGTGTDIREGNDMHADLARDRIIQQTDGDASSSRMSAVALAYLDDPYAQRLYQLPGPVAKRYPIINRGTYVRTTAIDRLVTLFLNGDGDGDGKGARKQIISLGAGSDTRFFRLCAGKHNVLYHELDFEDNVRPKRDAIRNSAELARMATPPAGGPSSSYHLHAIDLRLLTTQSPPALPHFDPDLPTLILSECCLCYFPPDLATSVVNYFMMNIRASKGIILYEPVRPFDPFGRTMMANLASRGIELRTLKRYYSLDAQRRRLQVAGFESGQGARDVHQIWESSDWVSETERERIEKIEWLDEVEEWELLARHYCVSWAWKGDPFTAAWSSVEGHRTDDERMDDDSM